MSRNCGNCYLWQRRNNEDFGLCHAKAPLAYVFHNDNDKLQTVTRFPGTHENDYCGEHKNDVEGDTWAEG